MKARLAVSGWSAISPAGIGAPAFSEYVTSGCRGTRDGPHAELGSVPGFEVRALLGRKNTRSMDRVTGMVVLTVGRLLESERAAGHIFSSGETGLVLGTTSGSIQSMMDFSRDSFTQNRPFLVDPGRFPNAVMNCAAGQSAIWHGLRGPNATISSGHVAGLSALAYAARLYRDGHARTVLCGAAEELTPQRIWLERRRQKDGGTPASLGEGCAIFRMESPGEADAAGRPVLALLVAAAFRMALSPSHTPGALADCAMLVLKDAGCSAADVWMLAADLTGVQQAALTDVVSARPRWCGLAGVFGDTGAASAALNLAAILAHAAADPSSRGRLVLVAAADREGVTGVAAFRLPGHGIDGQVAHARD